VKFEKPSLTVEQQADLLIQRGMQGDRGLMIERLSVVGYYRLSGYWYPFRKAAVDSFEPTGPAEPDEIFLPGTSFDVVWRRYAFDRRLRLLLMDAIERFEITLRTQLAFHHTQQFGPFAYALDRATRPKFKRTDFAAFYAGVLDELGRSKEPFIKHFYEKYGDEHDVPPFWVSAEVITFGSLVTFYRNTTHSVKQAVAGSFGVPDTVMESWLLALNTIRNICAHHSRLWNRELGNRPMIPRAREYPDWHEPVPVGSGRIFGILTICKYCLDKLAPQSGWAGRFHDLLGEYSEVPLESMGFPENWRESPIWKKLQKGVEYGT
jgi:abortive infection bacteriophage resistance protein